MSFTTRCPACGTTFKVVPDQLKISDGWVRCGHCADVFDATLFLEGGSSAPAEVPAPPSPPPPSPPLSSQVTPSAKVVISRPPPPDGDGDGDWLLRPTAPRRSRVDAGNSRFGPASVPAPEPAEDGFEEELRRFAGAAQAATPVAGASEALTATAAPASVAEAASDEDLPSSPIYDEHAAPLVPDRRVDAAPPETDAPAPRDEPSFVRQARRKAFWHSRGMRGVLWGLCGMLALGLMGQVMVHERDSLAARLPAAGGWLAAACRPLGCSVGAVHQIESVVIDSSNLARRLDNFYAFDLVLKNTATVPVAFPALELSLTDSRENVIVRRVFLPDELPGAPVLLPAQGHQSVSLRLSIADQSVSSMSGYRALVFYP